MAVVAVGAVLVLRAVGHDAASGAAGVDGFERPDAASLGSTPGGLAWHDDDGSAWGVQDGRARVVDGPQNGYATAWVDAGIEGDVVVSADVTLSSTPARANAGLVFRYADANDHLWTKIELTEGHPRGMVSIGKVSGGTLTSLLGHTNGIGLRGGATYRLEVRIRGRLVTSTVRGPGLEGPVSASYTLTEAEAAAFAGNGGYGLRTKLAPDEDDGGSRWDDFRVSPA